VYIEVINGKLEADLITNTFWTQDLLKERSYLYIDVGGGSTELTWLEKGRRVKSASFKIGTVRWLKGKVKEESWEEMRAFLEDLRAKHGALMAIGTGGNINRIFKENGNAFGEPLARTDYEIIDEMSVGLGYYNLATVVGSNGQRRGIDGSDNIWWSPSARVIATDTAHLDKIYDRAAGIKKPEEKKAGSLAPKPVAY
jgi:hypothetical protein